MGYEQLAESRCLESEAEKEVRKTDIAMGDCIMYPRKSEIRTENKSNG